MAPRGPKPTPTALRPIKGGMAEAERAEEEVAAAAAEPFPDPPDWLLADALDEWNRLGPRLHRAGLLTELDRGPFAAVCQAYGTWAFAEKQMAKVRAREIEAAEDEGKGADAESAGFVSRTAAGNLVHHPLASIASKARAEYVKTCVEFGLTPSSRARIDTDKAKNRGGGNPTKRFFTGRPGSRAA